MGGPSPSQSASITCNNKIPWYFLISWLFWMGSHWQYRYAKSSLFSQAVLCGRRTSAKEGLSAKFELISSFTLASQSSFVSYKKWKTNKDQWQSCRHNQMKQKPLQKLQMPTARWIWHWTSLTRQPPTWVLSKKKTCDKCNLIHWV